MTGKKIHSPLRQNLQSVASAGKTLPGESYTDAAYAEIERQVIFEQGWMAIGFASEVPDPGDCMPRRILGKPVLVSRDHNNKLHVFANLCRHRGHLLVTKPCAGNKSITCPYHAWSYALDGGFLNAPYWDGTPNSSPDADVKRKLSLSAIRFAVWYNIIFVNFSAEAEPFNQVIGPLQQRWADARPAALLRSFSSRQYTIQGNWKLAAENFLDNYHLPWVHPEVGSSMEARLGLDVENLRLCSDIIGFSHPTAGKDKGKTAIPLPLWPDITSDQQLRQDLFYFLPNTCLVMEGDYLWSMLLLPEGAESCEEKISLYVVGDAAMAEQFSGPRDQLGETIYRINDQDAVAISNLQLGRHSSAASECVFNDRHDQLAKWFHQRVAERMLASAP